jgi:hypothetical protein
MLNKSILNYPVAYIIRDGVFDLAWDYHIDWEAPFININHSKAINIKKYYLEAIYIFK